MKKHEFFRKISIFAVCLLFPYKAVLNLVKAVYILCVVTIDEEIVPVLHYYQQW